ncbi:MAG: NCS2 family permease [Candidatus Rokubacteria bacterium]|nr:NCS2 family permease [Candidatus Rokubacteria bacterium]
MVMAYIIFVNPAILSFAGVPGLEGKGAPFAATQAATCLVAGVLTIAMGLWSHYPLALASGMGLNAVVAFQLMAGMKLSWQGAMGVVFLEGLVITVLVLTGFREAIMNAIPLALKQAIGAGIGLFILFIGLVSAGIVKPGPPGVPVTLGQLTAAPVAVAVAGLLLTLWLQARGALTVMPFTYSITNGIGAGFVAYCFIKLCRGRGRQVHPMMYVASAAFVVYFALAR